MALFTDTDIVTLDDLLQFEGSLVQVSSSHGIDVQTKINLAICGISDKLMLWLLQVRASDPQWLSRRLLGLSTVVVTPALHRWLCFESLASFFDEAYNLQLNTRFQGKLTDYRQRASAASGMLFMLGIGVVYIPLPRPGAPAATLGDGTSTPGALFVQTAWADGEGNEGALSPVTGVLITANSGVTVTMAETSSQTPATAVGWNIYASTTENGLTRQNNAPLPIGSAWMLPANGIMAGPEPIDGQQPNVYVVMSKQIQRG